MNGLSIAIVSIMGLAAFMVTSQALREHSTLQYPGILAALVATLGCLGIYRTCGELIPVILFPAMALVIAVGLIWLITSGARARRVVPDRLPVIKKEKPKPKDDLKNELQNPWRASK